MCVCLAVFVPFPHAEGMRVVDGFLCVLAFFLHASFSPSRTPPYTIRPYGVQSKGFNPQERDVSIILAIHNAVNEQGPPLRLSV